jgi:acylphosphatase
MEQIHAHALISGHVQGVGYRFSTRNEATYLGLQGWVRNLPDGRVEAVFEGNRPQVEKMVQWCHQGPPGAQVQDVKIAYTVLEGLRGFEIRRS